MCSPALYSHERKTWKAPSLRIFEVCTDSYQGEAITPEVCNVHACSCYQTPLHIKNGRGLLSFALDLWLIVPLDISWHHLTMFICSLLSLLYSLDGEEPYGPYAIVTTSKRVSQLGYGHKTTNWSTVRAGHHKAGEWLACIVWFGSERATAFWSKANMTGISANCQLPS